MDLAAQGSGKQEGSWCLELIDCPVRFWHLSFTIQSSGRKILMGWGHMSLTTEKQDPFNHHTHQHCSLHRRRKKSSEGNLHADSKRNQDEYVCVLAVQSCLTLSYPMNCSPPGSSVLGILQARILEWVAISFSRGSSQPRVSRMAGRLFTSDLGQKKQQMFTLHVQFQVAKG